MENISAVLEQQLATFVDFKNITANLRDMASSLNEQIENVSNV